MGRKFCLTATTSLHFNYKLIQRKIEEEGTQKRVNMEEVKWEQNKEVPEP